MNAPDLFLQVCAQPTLDNALRLLTARELAELITWFDAKASNLSSPPRGEDVCQNPVGHHHSRHAKGVF